MSNKVLSYNTISISIIVTLGISALAGWVTGIRVLASVRPEYIPMAPGTAFSFIGSGMVLLLILSHISKTRQWISAIVVGCISAYGFLNCASFLLSNNTAFFDLLTIGLGKIGLPPIQQMSPVTAGVFFLSGIAIELKLWSRNGRFITNIITGIGLCVFSVGFVAALGYIFGTPILYGSTVIPLAATTAAGFIFLGASLNFAAGTDGFLLKHVVGDSPNAKILRWLFPAIIGSILLDSFLDEKIIILFNLSALEKVIIECIIYPLVIGFFALRITRSIFRHAETAEVERNRAVEALKESEERYRSFIETLPDGVYRSSHEGKFIEINIAMVKLLGYDSKEELKRIDIKSDLYFSEQDRDSAALEEDLVEMAVFPLRKKDGSKIWVEDHGRHVIDENNQILYHEGILRDVTERKRSEDEQQRLFTELQSALAEVKMLGGLIPICSSCKKVRDDAGFWNQIEQYLSKHSGAKFSHGLCPECMQRDFPDAYNKMQSQNEI